MKKLLFAFSLLIVFTLTGCQDKPFETDLDGYTFTETDNITFEFDSGNGSVELFRYTFDTELKVFISESGTVYNFTNINDYQVASDEIEKLLAQYEDTTMFRTRERTDFADEVELSTGATEDEYNYVMIAHDGNVFQEDAFIVTENGMTMIVSYTRFFIDGERLYVPSYIQLFVNTIHQEVSWEFLGVDNEYSEDRMKLITYELLIVPTPMKTGAFSSYEEMIDNNSEVDDFTRVVSDSTDHSGTWPVCSGDTSNNCINPISTTLDVQIYEMTIDDVKLFYEENFGAQYVDGYFTFFNLDQAFVIYDMEEVQVRDDLGEIVDVVNAKIRLF